MVYMLLGTGFEETEAITPIDLLRRAGVTVLTVGLNGKVIYGSHGIGIVADILPEANDELEGQQQLPWFDADPDDHLAFLNSACKNEFSREQMEVIFTTICMKDLEHPEGIEVARFHYLQRKYALLNLRAQNEAINHRFEYFKAMLENDPDYR